MIWMPLQSLVEALARKVADAFSPPLDALRETPPHTRNATADARIRLDAWVKHRPVPYTVFGAAAGGAVAVALPTNLGLWVVPLAAAAAGLAAAAVPAAAFVCFWVMAPARQRDEAREALDKKPRAKVRRAPPSAPPKAPERSYLTGYRISKALEEGRAKRLGDQIQDELVAIIDQGRTLSPNAFDEAGYGPFKLWNGKTDSFLSTVLGPLEAQRFREHYEPPPVLLSETVEYRLKRLADLRDRPGDWTPQVDAEGLRDACEVRRHVSQADLVVLAGGRGRAGQVHGQLDRAAVGVEFRSLADALDAAIANRGGAEEREIAATERRASEVSPARPSDAVHDLAESYAASATRDAVLGEFGPTLDKLVTAAIEFGSVSRLERERYVQPEDDAFKSLPDALRRVANRIESFEPPADS
jgi:hypothetical protein